MVGPVMGFSLVVVLVLRFSLVVLVIRFKGSRINLYGKEVIVVGPVNGCGCGLVRGQPHLRSCVKKKKSSGLVQGLWLRPKKPEANKIKKSPQKTQIREASPLFFLFSFIFLTEERDSRECGRRGVEVVEEEGQRNPI